MTPKATDPAPPPGRVVGIGAAVAVMVAIVLVVGNRLTRDDGLPDHPPPLRTEGETYPIAAEADVFRLNPEEMGAALSAAPVTAAHARTMWMHRTLRAYPGAPPRIPHGLSSEEFRAGTCNVCHRRGGYVPRFGNYAPVTPHPEQTGCVQCHAPRDALVGLPLPVGGESATCGQCHIDPGARPLLFVASDWASAAWPETDRRALPGSPPRIPHRLENRGNCLACHAGPGAVVEIRTDHPERANCRQCHVPLASDAGFLPPPLGGESEPSPDDDAPREEAP